MLLIVLCLICACQAVQKSRIDLLNLNSERVKVEVFNFDEDEYLFFGYKVTFDEAHVICLNYNAQLAIVDTEEKMEFIVHAMTNILEFGEFWVGTPSDITAPLPWNDKKEKLSHDHIIFGDSGVWKFSGLQENNNSCLIVIRKIHRTSIFLPLQCSKKRPFICQREPDTSEMKANEIDVIKVDNEEFTLYSARATWADAVVQCRENGLQIAEVKSAKEAEAIAMSMLRARPDAMENVWIGGYLREKSWEWLASSEPISFNELWPNDTQLSFGCLLLDRHISESPIYLSAQCGRKRHVLCQKPPLKIFSKKPTPIDVEGCPYLVGFYPLQWFEANRSCQDINASLVVLDSSKIIQHMMILMADYKQEIRHIWTDGQCRENKTSLAFDTSIKTWFWTSTGEKVPGLESFIPWYTIRDDVEDANCLNLDRQDYDTAVVYGLSCRKNQSYVCQPWKGRCVSHQGQDLLPNNSEVLNLYSRLEDIKPVTTPATLSATTLSQNSPEKTAENVFYVSDNMSKMQKMHSTVSDYTSFGPHSTSQQLTYKLEETTQFVTSEGHEGKSDNEKKLETIVPDEVNQTNSKNIITDFFSPLIQFTLPSLPQFGIKVVSAAVTTPKSEIKKIYVSSKPKGSITKIISNPEKMNNRAPVMQSDIKDLKRISGNLQQYRRDPNMKIILKTSNKNSAPEKTESKVKIKSPVTEKVNINTLPVATEKMDNHSSVGLYGDDMDYLDTLSSKPENPQNGETSDDYDELMKSLVIPRKSLPLLNENKGNSKLDQPLGEILQKKLKSMIQSELKLKNNFQQTPVQLSPKNRINIPLISNKPKYRVESMSNNNMDFKNTEVRKDPSIQRHNTPDLIPPFYGFESPLKVELLDDGTGITLAPVVLTNRKNFEEKDSTKTEDKLNATHLSPENKGNSLDFQLSDFNPHDKDSMLQLGRLLKQMFIGENHNAQKINFNLITRRAVSEPSPQEIISRNEDKSQTTSATTIVTTTPVVTTTPDDTTNPDDTANSDVTTTPVDFIAPIITNIVQFTNENKTLINCQKELEKFKKTTSPFDNLEVEYLQASCKSLPVLVPFAPFRIPRMSSKNGNEYNYRNSSPNVENSLFNVFKDLVKGIRIDIKEVQLKSYVKRFVQERLPNPEDFDFDTNSGKSWHEVFKKILNSLNGTAIRFHGERVLLRFGSFGYKKSKSKMQIVTPGKAPTPPESYDYTTLHRINDQDDQDKFNQNQNLVLQLDASRLIEDQLNNTHEKEYLFSSAQSKNNDFNNKNKNKRTKYKSDTRRVKQKTTSEIEQQDRLESNLKRWSNLRNEKEKLKTRVHVQERESIQGYQEIKNKMFSPSNDWKSKTINSGENLDNPKNYEESSNFNEQDLRIENKLTKKSITEANEENPFPDFPVINFDMRRTEDLFDSGFETIRVGRAARNRDVLSIVSVYIVMKYHIDEEDEQYSVPILELHVRMPADSLPLEEKHNPYYRTRTNSYQQIQDSKVTSNPRNLELKIIQEAQVTRRRKPNQDSEIVQRKPERKLKSRKTSQNHKKTRNQDRLKDSDLQNIKNKTEFNYEKANDFLTNIIENVTNFKTLTDLKRKRQLLYLALRYLRHVSDERFKEQSRLSDGKQLLGIMQETKENRKIYRSPMPNANFRIQVPLPIQIGLGSNMIFNPTENELNPQPLMFNQMPMFNYNMRQYDDMAFNGIKRSYNPRIRRNVEQSKNLMPRIFFLNNAQLNKQ